eukprot:1001550_1
MSEGKTDFGVVIVGNVDAGKSTTTGRFLFELGGMRDRDLAKLKKEAQELGKESFLFEFFMDKGKMNVLVVSTFNVALVNYSPIPIITPSLMLLSREISSKT